MRGLTERERVWGGVGGGGRSGLTYREGEGGKERTDGETGEGGWEERTDT